MASWRDKSNKSYNYMFGKWISWCKGRGSDPISCPVSEVCNFLASLFEENYSYRSLNVYRSAISSAHDSVDGLPVGQHPMVTRLLSGAFNSRPPQPRYSSTWDVNVVISYISSLPKNGDLSLNTKNGHASGPN